MSRILTLRLAAALAGLAALLACSGSSEDPAPDKELVSSRSYKGHENDADSNNFVNAYRATVGTRLDDCQTCHRGGEFTAGGRKLTKNSCDYCHLIIHPASGFEEKQPTAYAETLNPYGAAYRDAGRSKQALLDVDGQDSDGDGAANGVEIADLKYPGDPTSKPGQPNAPQKTFTLAELEALAAHDQFQLNNSTKQEFDDYASYKGVKLRDLLVAAGVDPADPKITGVTVIAPDGYLKDFSIEQVNKAYPKGLFYAGLDTATLGPACGFVTYPEELPEGLVDGGEIPGEQWLLLAYERDGRPLDPCNLDVTEGKINGEGPLRIVVPQRNPGHPDRGTKYSPSSCNDGHDFDAEADHNAGEMVRGAVALRINPLPAGVEDFDARNGGWSFIANSSLLVYGYGIE